MRKWRSWLKRDRLKIYYIRNTVGSNPTFRTITNATLAQLAEATGLEPV